MKLARTRRARDFSYGFAVLNLAGIGMLLMRSLELGEPGFIATNAVTGTFWAGVLAVKVIGPRDSNPDGQFTGP